MKGPTMSVDDRTAPSQPAEKMRYLSELTVFQDLTGREMEDLNRITTMSTVSKGRVFYRPEEPGEVLFILKEGQVKAIASAPKSEKLGHHHLGASHPLWRDGPPGYKNAQHLRRGCGRLPGICVMTVRTWSG